MGSFDGDKICELVGCLFPYNLNNIVDPYSHGLYHDDGFIILGNSTPKNVIPLEKKIPWVIQRIWLQIGNRNESKNYR